MYNDGVQARLQKEKTMQCYYLNYRNVLFAQIGVKTIEFTPKKSGRVFSFYRAAGVFPQLPQKP